MDRARPDLRPLGIGEMVDGALRLYRTNFLTLIKISGAVLAPLGLIQLVATVMVGPVDFNAFATIDPNATPSEALAPLIPLYTTLGITSLFTLAGSVLELNLERTEVGKGPHGRQRLLYRPLAALLQVDCDDRCQAESDVGVGICGRGGRSTNRQPEQVDSGD